MPHFTVTYAVSAPDEAGARAVVDALCLEQTVELPLVGACRLTPGLTQIDLTLRFSS